MHEGATTWEGRSFEIDDIQRYKETETLEGTSYIDIGIMPGGATTTYERMMCTSCGKRFNRRQISEFERLTKEEGYNNREAMKAIGIGSSDLKTTCCYASFSTPHWVPTTRSGYDPDLMKGLTEVPNPEPWLKYRGNMIRNPKEGAVVDIEHLVPSRRGPPEQYGVVIPDGYRFIDWERLDNTWAGKHVDMWVPRIVESLKYVKREREQKRDFDITLDEMNDQWEGS